VIGAANDVARAEVAMHQAITKYLDYFEDELDDWKYDIPTITNAAIAVVTGEVALPEAFPDEVQL